jgi:predicted DNA-binding transcriptional regulator AlpA
LFSEVVMNFLRTPAAAERLGVSDNLLYNLVKRRRIPAPPRDSSRCLIWFESDLAGVREYLSARERCKRQFPAPAHKEQNQ